MIITLTAEQYEAFQSNLFSEDDPATRIPEFVSVGEPAVNDDGTAAIGHPGLSMVDQVVLIHVLDERAQILSDIKALPQADRAEARRTVRRGIRRNNRRIDRRIERRAARRDESDIDEEFRAELYLRFSAEIAAAIAAL